MSIPLYGQNKDGDALSSVSLSRGYLKITAGLTLDGSDGGVVHIADTDACAIVLPTITAALHGLEYRFIMAVDAGGSITITSGSDAVGDYYQGTLAVHSVDADDGFAANGSSNNIITMNATTTGGLLGSEINLRAHYKVGWIVWGNVLGTNATGATPFSG